MSLLHKPNRKSRIIQRLPLANANAVGIWVVGAVLLFASHANADKLATLSQKLSSSSETQRASAAISLGKSKDTRALKPLVKALRDKNSSVRRAAALALGGLGDSRALPALQRATRDSDREVRIESTAAIGIIKHNSSAQMSRGRKSGRISRIRVNGREAPRITARKPKVHLVIRTLGDESKSKASKQLRRTRAKSLGQLMSGSIAGTNHFTTNAATAAELKLPLYNLDLSITRLDRVINGPWVEMHCEIRVAISNRKGKMVSFLTGGAKTQVPRRTFKTAFEDNMRKEAIAGAAQGIHADLLRYLIKSTGV